MLEETKVSGTTSYTTLIHEALIHTVVICKTITNKESLPFVVAEFVPIINWLITSVGTNK